MFVGLGCPRQEVFLFENRERVGVPLVAVGAAFDFHAGLVPQARAPAVGGDETHRDVRIGEVGPLAHQHDVAEHGDGFHFMFIKEFF